MENKHLFQIIVNKEKLSDGTPVYVAHCLTLEITSQGFTFDEAMKNIKEAIQLYLEELPEKVEEIQKSELPTISFVEVPVEQYETSKIDA